VVFSARVGVAGHRWLRVGSQVHESIPTTFGAFVR
jgi:hypothetical protein